MKENKKCAPCVRTSIGGQALIEGIMMRGPKKTAMAVRNTDGEIVLEEVEFKQKKRPKFTKWPFVRGVFNFIDSMSMGYKSLMRSAEISGLEEAEEELAREKEAKKLAKAQKKAEKKSEPTLTEEKREAEPTAADEPAPSEKIEVSEKSKKETSALVGVIMVVGMVIAFVFAFGLFFMVPNLFCSWILGEDPNPVLYALISGLIKAGLLVAYMSLVSLMKDIKRTFMYHGAEHKTIFCYERGEELTVENVRKQTRFHPRCGTSFLFLMILVSMIVMIFVGVLLRMWLPSYIIESQILYTLIRTGIAILLIPFMAGVGYEILKLAGRRDNIFTRVVSAPGLWMQRITTKEPDDSMIECAIAAMKEVIPEDGSDKI